MRSAYGRRRPGLPPSGSIVVDVANVMGSRPDGWWRDRPGAAVRLHAEIAELAARGRPVLPDDTGPEEFVMVLEGATKAAAPRGSRTTARCGSSWPTGPATTRSWRWSGSCPAAAWWSPPTASCGEDARRRGRTVLRPELAVPAFRAGINRAARPVQPGGPTLPLNPAHWAPERDRSSSATGARPTYPDTRGLENAVSKGFTDGEDHSPNEKREDARDCAAHCRNCPVRRPAARR